MHCPVRRMRDSAPVNACLRHDQIATSTMVPIAYRPYYTLDSRGRPEKAAKSRVQSPKAHSPRQDYNKMAAKADIKAMLTMPVMSVPMVWSR